MGAVFAASLKAAFVGGLITAAYFTLMWLSPNGNSTSGLLGTFVFAGFILFLSISIGTIAIALCLTLFGLPIAYLLRDSLATGFGSTVAMLSAVIVSALVALLVSGGPAVLVILPYAIPAAIFFRREILLERELP